MPENIGGILFATAVAAIPWLFPELDWQYKIILTLITIIILLIVLIKDANHKIADKDQQIKILEQKLAETKNRHRALAVQFEQKSEEFRRYQAAFGQIGQLIAIALINTKEAKISKIHEGYLRIQAELVKGGKKDE